MTVILLIITALCAYFLGGLNGAIIASKYIWKKDIRQYGSGNAGLTNFFRIFGAKGILVVILTDVLKSVAAVLIGTALIGLRGEPVVGKFFAGFCLMLGHVYPVFYDFKGGKAVLCAGTLAWMLDWRIGLLCWGVFIILTLATRYVSLGSIAGAALMPIGSLLCGFTGLESLLALLCALLLIFKHIPNITRLIKGTESKLTIGKPKPPGY